MATTISSTTSTSSSGAITTQGIGSGLDIASIVDKLVSIESQPLNDLKTKEAAYQTKVSALASVTSALGQFQTTVAALTTPTAFSSLVASIADSTIAGVAVDSTKANALPVGAHTLQVTNLATAQRTGSGAFADTTSAIGSGSVTIDIGSWDSGYSTFTPNATVGSKTITIDGSNNSLAGVRDAINAAGAGVTASIINDGSGNRLVVASNSTGAVNGFRITTSDADGNDVDATGLSQVAFDPAASGGTPQTQHLVDGKNANFLLDGLAISKASNHVTDVIDGLTLDLKAQSANGATSFGVARDTTTAKSSVNAFVSAYNTIAKGLKSLTSYDTTSKTAGVLNGDATIRLIATRLQSLVATVLPGSGSVNSLADVGVTFGDGGILSVDDTKLTAALTSSPDAVSRLFAKTGASTDALVSYATATDKTQAGAHAVNVSRLATQGSLTGSSSAGLTITAGVNDTVGLTVDNVGITIVLAPGTYADASALASQVQSQINGTSALSSLGSNVTVTATNGVLGLVSKRYGSASNVGVADGNGVANLFGPSPTSAAGVDVAGSIDGVAFLGQGQTATGAASTAAEGLGLTITGGTLGARGTVTFTRGLAAQVNDTLTQLLDSTNGLLSVETAGLNSSITDLQKQEDRQNVRLVAIRAQLTAQYNAMDTLVASLNSTSSYLTTQLAALAKSTSSSS